MPTSSSMRRVLVWTGALALVAGAASCGSTADPTAAPAASVALSDTAVTLRVGDDAALAARVFDVGRRELVGRRIFWSSRDTSIVQVTQAGVLRAVKTGTTQVAANIEGQSAVAAVTVLARPIATLQIDPPTAQLVVTTRRRLAVRALNDQGTAVAVAVTWTSLNPAVVLVSSDGEVTGVSPGVGTVQAVAGGQTATAAIVVTAVPVASVRLTPAADTLAVGATRQFTAAPLDSTGATLSARAVAWTSRDPGVASVSSTGLVTAVAPGTATVVATVEGRTATASVLVRAARVSVAAVAVAPATASVPAGSAVQLTATPRDAGGNALTDRVVAWSSSNESVASVSSTGRVLGTAPGTATIRATSEGVTGTATVTVTQVVRVSPTTLALRDRGTSNRTGQLTATDQTGRVLLPAEVTWTSSNPAIATVDGTGLVRGVSTGTATITVTSKGASATAMVTVSNS